MRLKDKLHSLQFLTRHKLFRTLLVLILRRDEARTPLSHLSWPPYPFCLLNTLYYKTYIYIFCKKPNHWELVSCWRGSNRASFNWFQSLYDYLKILKELDWTACKNQTIFFPHLIWLCPPATFASIHRLPGHTCTLIWAPKGGGGINSTWKWAGDCMPPLRGDGGAWVIASLKPLLGGWLAADPRSSGVTRRLIRPHSACQGPPWLHNAT